MISVIYGKHLASDSYGHYYDLKDGRGVKVLKHHFSTQNEAMNSQDWTLAQGEAKIIQDTFPSGVVPECFGVEVVTVQTGVNSFLYAAGIVMQHLGTTRFADAGRNLPHEQQALIKNNLRMALNNMGYEHGDFHDANIMVFEGRYYIIDLSPQFTKTAVKKVA